MFGMFYFTAWKLNLIEIKIIFTFTFVKCFTTTLHNKMQNLILTDWYWIDLNFVLSTVKI